MANEKMMTKNNAKLIATGVGAAALATATMAYNKIRLVKESKETSFDNISQDFAPCPTCGTIINKKRQICSYCHSVNQTCISCGHLFDSNARFCPDCGMESDTGGSVVVNGRLYKGTIREPFPTYKVSYDYCCCGTPFADHAKYCQLCGRKRPNPGKTYLRDEPVSNQGKNEGKHIVMQTTQIVISAYGEKGKEILRNEQTQSVQGEKENT